MKKIDYHPDDPIYSSIPSHLHKRTKEMIIKCATELDTSKRPKIFLHFWLMNMKNTVENADTYYYKRFYGIKNNFPSVCKLNLLLKIFGWTALHMAVFAEDIDLINEYIGYGMSVNVQDNGHFIPLHIAMAIGNYKIVEKLISCGANINHSNKINMTPVHCIYNNNSVNLYQLLFKYNANLKIIDGFNRSCLNLISLYYDEQEAIKCLHFLVENGLDINNNNLNDETPLDSSISFLKKKLTLEIIKYGGRRIYDYEQHLEFVLTGKYGPREKKDIMQFVLAACALSDHEIVWEKNEQELLEKMILFPLDDNCFKAADIKAILTNKKIYVEIFAKTRDFNSVYPKELFVKKIILEERKHSLTEMWSKRNTYFSILPREIHQIAIEQSIPPVNLRFMKNLLLERESSQRNKSILSEHGI